MLLILSLFFISPIVAKTNTFMPENDLWRQDCVNCFNANGMDQQLFTKIIEAGKKGYAENARQNGEQLVINNKWTDSTVNADCCRGCEYGKVIVNMYGGMARRSEMNPEGFALVLGHELSHAYGGTPYIEAENRMSAEGQSDYEGARTAYRKIAAYVPELKQDLSYDEYVGQLCAQKTGDDFKDCVHGLAGGQALGNLLATLSGEPVPSYQTPDQTRVSRTETSYPATVQCRLDTYLVGTLNRPRPACWFKASATDPNPTPEPTSVPTPEPTSFPTPEPTPWPEPNDPWQWPTWDWPWDWPTWPW